MSLFVKNIIFFLFVSHLSRVSNPPPVDLVTFFFSTSFFFSQCGSLLFFFLMEIPCATFSHGAGRLYYFRPGNFCSHLLFNSTRYAKKKKGVRKQYGKSNGNFDFFLRRKTTHHPATHLFFSVNESNDAQ